MSKIKEILRAINAPADMGRRRLMENAVLIAEGGTVVMALGPLAAACSPQRPQPEIPRQDPFQPETSYEKALTHIERHMRDVRSIIEQKIKPEHYDKGLPFATIFSPEPIKRLPDNSLAFTPMSAQDWTTITHASSEALRREFLFSLVVLNGAQSQNVFYVETFYAPDGRLSGYDLLVQNNGIASKYIDPRIINPILSNLQSLDNLNNPNRIGEAANQFFDTFFVDFPKPNWTYAKRTQRGKPTIDTAGGILQNDQQRRILVGFESDGSFSYTVRESFYTTPQLPEPKSTLRAA